MAERKKDEYQVAIFQYIAFILKLYGAEPLSGMQHIHGKKGKAMIQKGKEGDEGDVGSKTTCQLNQKGQDAFFL